MTIKQLSVFIENKKGRLIAVTKCLLENNINIRALSLADTTDFGILRMIVDYPEKAHRALKDNGFTVLETDVLAMRVPDVPGGLNAALEALVTGNINVEYLYAFFGNTSEGAINIIRVDDMDRAKQIFAEKNIEFLSGDFLYNS